MKKIIDFLEQLGLSEIEANLYKGLLETGATTVKDLAEHVGIKRITAHFNIEHLIERGLVTQVKKGQKRNIVAEPPERLGDLIKQKEQEIEAIKNNLQDTVDTLYSIIPSAKEESGVEVKYYEGRNGVRSIYKEVLKSNELRSFVNISKIFDLFPENPELFPENMDKGHLQMWEIIEDSPRSREYVKETDPTKYKYKFFPQAWGNEVFFDFMIFDGKVAIITAKNSDPSGILINNRDIYGNMRFIFDIVWKLLPESDVK